MKPLYKYIIISLGIVLVIGYLMFTWFNFSGKNNDVVCGNMKIEYSESKFGELISQAEIARLLDKKDLNPIGKTLKRIHTKSIEKALLKSPLIKDAECFKTPTGVVKIKIEQRCPKFRVVGYDNYYVDTDRELMPVSTEFSAYVPVVSGRVTKTRAKTFIFDFITYLEENPFWNDQIEQIYIREDLKVELVPRIGEGIILLGTLNDYAKKLGKLEKLYSQGFNTIGWNRYKTIDLQYKDQVICTRADKEDNLPAEFEVVEKTDSIIASKI